MATRRSVARAVSVLVMVAVGLGACGGQDKVGEGLGVEGRTGTSTCRLGECTSTTTPPTTAPVATTVATTSPPKTTTTTAKPQVTTTTTAPPQQAVFAIKIQSDSASGGHFLPRVASVRQGVLVRWTNTDTLPRSVEADDGSFRSPEIAPGGTFELTASTPGTFNYHDGTRPYAVGTLQVS